MIRKTKTKTRQAKDQRIYKDKDKDKDEDGDKLQSVIRWATRRDSPEPDKRHFSIHTVDKDKDKAGQRPTHRQR